MNWLQRYYELTNIYNPLSALAPMLIGAVFDDENRWRGGLVGLVVDRIFCVVYYWVLGKTYPWMFPWLSAPIEYYVGVVLVNVSVVLITWYLNRPEPEIM